MEEGVLSLRWNNHRSTFFHVLSSLHRKELYSDATIACSGRFFPVHKLVLSVCSEYFEDMFKHTTCKHPVVVLKDILHDDMEALLNYMYAGEANVAQSDLARLIKAAECLRIKGLAVPDEAPVANETKRARNEVNEESPLPKKRREDVSSPSKSSQTKDQSDVQKQTEFIQKESNGVSHHSDIHIFPQEYSRLSEMESSSQEDHQNMTPNVTEVVLNKQAAMIKEELTEPKHEQEDEISHLTDSEGSITYNPSNSLDERQQGVGVELYDPQLLSTSHPQSVVQDIMVQGIGGPSSVSVESLPGWDSSGNVSGFSLENFTSEDSRSQTSGFSSLYAEGRKTHQCLVCFKTFPKKDNFVKHQRTHTGERPFCCPYCDFRGSQKSTVTRHIGSKHRTAQTKWPLSTPH